MGFAFSMVHLKLVVLSGLVLCSPPDFNLLFDGSPQVSEKEDLSVNPLDESFGEGCFSVLVHSLKQELTIASSFLKDEKTAQHPNIRSFCLAVLTALFSVLSI